MADSPIVQKLLAMSKENKMETGEDFLELSRSLTPTPEDVELGRLNWSPKKNWVDMDPAGKGLPKYIEDVAIGIMKSGKTREQAIPIAISRIKRWAAGLDGVKKDTQAKAIAALAAWEALKARAAARRAKKKG